MVEVAVIVAALLGQSWGGHPTAEVRVTSGGLVQKQMPARFRLVPVFAVKPSLELVDTEPFNVYEFRHDPLLTLTDEELAAAYPTFYFEVDRPGGSRLATGTSFTGEAEDGSLAVMAFFRPGTLGSLTWDAGLNEQWGFLLPKSALQLMEIGAVPLTWPTITSTLPNSSRVLRLAAGSDVAQGYIDNWGLSHASASQRDYRAADSGGDYLQVSAVEFDDPQGDALVVEYRVDPGWGEVEGGGTDVSALLELLETVPGDVAVIKADLSAIRTSLGTNIGSRLLQIRDAVLESRNATIELVDYFDALLTDLQTGPGTELDLVYDPDGLPGVEERAAVADDVRFLGIGSAFQRVRLPEGTDSEVPPEWSFNIPMSTFSFGGASSLPDFTLLVGGEAWAGFALVRPLLHAAILIVVTLSAVAMVWEEVRIY